MLGFLKSVLILLAFPLYVVIHAYQQIWLPSNKTRSISEKIKKILQSMLFFCLSLFILIPIWFVGYTSAGIIIARQLRFLAEPIPISGTGSMYPTFPKGKKNDLQQQSREIVSTPGMLPYPSGLIVLPPEMILKFYQLFHDFRGQLNFDQPPLSLLTKRYFGYTISRGDIVTFQNPKVLQLTAQTTGKSSGLVKRVIGLPNDTLEIKEGLVFINGQSLDEPYIAKARSTFGGDFLPDCHSLAIPNGKLFVMGDNRKGSNDSRQEVGLIDLSDVDHVLPLSKQAPTLTKNWRDTTDDLKESSKIKIDRDRFLELLNQKRQQAGLKRLSLQPKLAKSANLRGEIILKYNDFSFEATKSGYTLKKSFQDAGYSNIVYGEAIAQGYYGADELIDNLFEFQKQKKFLLENDFQEFGLAEVEGQVNGCTTQVIVQHLAGYLPPNYTQDEINSWQNLISRLEQITPSWQNLKNESEFYQRYKTEVDRVNQIISLRLSHAQIILAKMKANQWFSDQEKGLIEQDKDMGQEQQELANKLNSQ